MRVWLLAAAAGMALSACQWIPGTDQNVIADAKRQVSAQLRDPSSAQFQKVRAVRQKDGSTAVCGEVNGRNAYGGYAGFSDFAVHDFRVFLRSELNSFADTAEIKAQTEVIRAHTNLCIYKGATPEEFDAEIAASMKRSQEILAKSGG